MSLHQTIAALPERDYEADRRKFVHVAYMLVKSFLDGDIQRDEYVSCLEAMRPKNPDKGDPFLAEVVRDLDNLLADPDYFGSQLVQSQQIVEARLQSGYRIGSMQGAQLTYARDEDSGMVATVTIIIGFNGVRCKVRMGNELATQLAQEFNVGELTLEEVAEKAPQQLAGHRLVEAKLTQIAVVPE